MYILFVNIYQKIICYLFDLFNLHANVEEKKMIGWSAKSTCTCNIDRKESVPPLLNSIGIEGKLDER